MTTRRLRVANAPISYGVVDADAPGTPPPDAVLAAISAAGYEGTELGPHGYLGRGATLHGRLAEHGLAVAGGYAAAPLGEPGGVDQALDAATAILDLFDEADAREAHLLLADAGSPERFRHPGVAAHDTRLGLDEDGWRRLASSVEHVAALAADRGVPAAFHPHLGTYVEAPWEIERLLELTEIPLALDTGHVALGGGDAVALYERYRERVTYVHLKDARRDVLESVVADGYGMLEAWHRGVFCELGAGDVDVGAFVDALGADGFAGWLVVEQDLMPPPGERPEDAAPAQDRNRRWLAERTGV